MGYDKQERQRRLAAAANFMIEAVDAEGPASEERVVARPPEPSVRIGEAEEDRRTPERTGEHHDPLAVAAAEHTGPGEEAEGAGARIAPGRRRATQRPERRRKAPEPAPASSGPAAAIVGPPPPPTVFHRIITPVDETIVLALRRLALELGWRAGRESSPLAFHALELLLDELEALGRQDPAALRERLRAIHGRRPGSVRRKSFLTHDTIIMARVDTLLAVVDGPSRASLMRAALDLVVGDEADPERRTLFEAAVRRA